MNKILLSLSLSILSLFAFSQQKAGKNQWRLTVVDSVTNKGIAGATISVGRNRDFATDDHGVVKIKNIVQGDTITITSIGYNKLIVAQQIAYKFPDTIRLRRSITELKEVKINSVTPTVSLVEMKDHYAGAYLPIPGEELAKYIPNSNRITGTIGSVDFVINDILKGIDMPFTVRLYTKNDTEMYPDKELLTDSIIVYNPKKQKRLSVDVSKYNIQIPQNGFFIVFEILDSSHYSKELIWYGGYQCVRVPGIDDDSNIFLIDTEEKDRHGASYCLLRRNKKHWAKWTVLDASINFAMGATIIPDQQ